VTTLSSSKADAGIAPLGRPAAYLAELSGTFGLVLFIVLVLSVSAPTPIGLGGPNFAVVVMQVAGAVLAVLLVKWLMSDTATAAHFGAPKVTTGQYLDGPTGKGLVVEAVGTFFLMWAVMGTVVNPRGNRSWGALVIGATLGLVVMCIAPLTGAAVNPARAFAPAIYGGFGPLGDWLLAFVVGPLAGAICAALLYTALARVPYPRSAAVQPSTTPAPSAGSAVINPLVGQRSSR
jgi:Major intrinsic protein